MGDLRRASFRGAKFWVEQDTVNTGRRLVVHEFPKRDLPYVEDMGRSANTVDITAYVCSDNAGGEASALRSACERLGPSTLQLPLERLTAHCESCSREFAKDKLGYVAFKLKFVREGGGAAPAPSAYVQRLTFVASQNVAAPLREAFVAEYTTAGLPGFVADDSADAIRDGAAALDAARAAVTLDAALAPGVARAIQDIYDGAASLAAVGMTGDTWESRAFISTASGSISAPVVEQFMSAAVKLREAAGAEGAILALADSTAYVEGPAPDPVTPSRRQAQANARAVARVVRVAALTQWVVAMTEAEYADRRAAISSRARVAAAIEGEIDTLAGPGAHGLYVALAELRGHAVNFFSRLITDMAPILAVGGNQSLPSLWWANTLYGDAARAGELAARNRVIHASFMPLEIEALAR